MCMVCLLGGGGVLGVLGGMCVLCLLLCLLGGGYVRVALVVGGGGACVSCVCWEFA